MEMKKRRIVVVGLGSIGRRHARLLSERGDLAVEFCEPDARALALARADAGDPREHAGLADALATSPEMVLIATPHGLHAAQTIAALEAGAHVFCEKPISDDPADARRMRAAADAAGRVLNVGFNMHFHPGVVRMREIIASGELGELLHIHCRVGSHITLLNSASRYQARLEGALLMDYTHQPDLLYLLTGLKPRGVFMAGGRGGRIEPDSNPNFLALTCDYDTPLIATVHLNYVQMPERHEYEIVGDRAWLHWDLKAGRLRVGRRAGDTETVEAVSTERDTMYRAEHPAFLEAVDGRRAP